MLNSVFRIRIRLHPFNLILPDPDSKEISQNNGNFHKNRPKSQDIIFQILNFCLTDINI